MTGSKYLVDTYAWIEYFFSTEKGIEAAKIIDERSNTLLVSDATFAELYSWAVRNKHDPGFLITLVRNRSQVVDIYTNIWLDAASKKELVRVKRKDFGLIDALLLSIQQFTGATIVTGDLHFKGMKNVVLL